jgi:NAD(P)H-dependent FMN reductase
MRTPRTAVLLVGSPKTGASTSASLGTYLLEELEKRGLRAQTIGVTTALRSEGATEQLYTAVAVADLVVLSFPLYVDSLPAPVIRALELIAARRAGATVEAAADRPAFVAICQCGFPEAEHNEVALEICASFARAAGFEWAGGLGMGAGGMVSEQPLRKIGGRLRSVVRALDLSAAELAAGRPVPVEAVRLMAKPAFPAFAYRLIANRGWRSELKRRGVGTPLDARPFA